MLMSAARGGGGNGAAAAAGGGGGRRRSINAELKRMQTLEAYNSDETIVDPQKPLDTRYVKHRYQEGKAVVFDDTHMHAVENTSTQRDDVRIVVWIDIVKKYPPRLAGIIAIGLAICRNAPQYLDCLEGREAADEC